jgi:hypothetical protein
MPPPLGGGRGRSYVGDNALDIGFEDMNTRLVVATPGNNEVCELLGGFDKLFMHGFEDFLIAVKHHVNSTSTLHYIATDITNEAYV